MSSRSLGHRSAVRFQSSGFASVYPFQGNLAILSLDLNRFSAATDAAVRLCASGGLCLLARHAAGRYGSGRRRLGSHCESANRYGKGPAVEGRLSFFHRCYLVRLGFSLSAWFCLSLVYARTLPRICRSRFGSHLVGLRSGRDLGY